MGLDFLGLAMSFATGGALLQWSIIDGYEFERCKPPGLTGMLLPELEPVCMEIADNIRTAERAGAVLLLLAGLTHLVMFVRASMAVYTRRKKYVPSRNSWMQLEKGTDRTPSLVTLELSLEAEKQRKTARKMSSLDGTASTP